MAALLGLTGMLPTQRCRDGGPLRRHAIACECPRRGQRQRRLQDLLLRRRRQQVGGRDATAHRDQVVGRPLAPGITLLRRNLDKTQHRPYYSLQSFRQESTHGLNRY